MGTSMRKRTHSKAQAAKTKFRSSSKWIKFRRHMKATQKVCAVTGKPLGPSANLHHMDLREENYQNLEDESHFVFLSKSAHDAIHWLWGKGTNNWREYLRAIYRILYKMERINRYPEIEHIPVT